MFDPRRDQALITLTGFDFDTFEVIDMNLHTSTTTPHCAPRIEPLLHLKVTILSGMANLE